MKKILILTTVLLTYGIISAQVPSSVKEALYKVNKTFDSSRFLAFDVNITFKSDTVLGKFENEEAVASYIVNSHNLYYKMGDIEFVQNDSFIYNIYHDEKMIMMTRQQTAENSSQFPLREFVDSTLSLYDSAYNITLSFFSDVSRMVAFDAKPAYSGLPYQRFAIYYDPATYFPQSFEIVMYAPISDLGNATESISASIKLKSVKKVLKMEFSNYRSPSDLAVFDNSSYVTYNRVRNRYQPATQWKDYRFLANGINGEYDQSIELYPPPTDQ